MPSMSGWLGKKSLGLVSVAPLLLCDVPVSVLLFSVGGSFRHFLWQVVRELQSSTMSLLLHCPSSSVGMNQGKFILAPGPISYAEEKLLQFFGQVSLLAGLAGWT